MKIFKTNNYNVFKSDICNRQVGKLKKLLKSMQEYGFLPGYPILVEKQKNSAGFVIKDGQHRYECAKLLKLPIYYTIHEGKTIQIPDINNAQRQWNTKDYLTSFCQQEKSDYVRLREFWEATGIGISQGAALLAGETGGGNNRQNNFKTGAFKVRDLDYANQVGEMVIFLKDHITWASEQLLVQALSRIFRVKEFKPAIFKERVKSCPGNLIKQPTLDATMQMLEVTYNHRSRSPIPLKFLADQAMRKRTFFHHKTENGK